MERLIKSDFFRRDPVLCARELIGCRFVWRGCAGRIVETEAYAAEGDPACHTFSRPSARDFVDRHPAGTAYIYLNYGVHWMFNVLVKGPDGAGFVLFRALEPLEGLEKMARRRGTDAPGALCSGPGKLTRALGIDGKSHGRGFLGRKTTGIHGEVAENVVADRRIGIRKGRGLPWRFLAEGSPFVSKPSENQ
jgi:DNA-3-methyladenine glycosylase